MRTETTPADTALPTTTLDRLWRGLASTALGQVLSATSSILLVPLFLRAWGADGYGKWVALTAIISYLSLLDLGGQNFIGNMLAREYVRGNENGFHKTLSEGVSLFALIALVAFSLLGLVLGLPATWLPSQLGPLSLNERLVLLLMGTSYLLSIPGGVYVTAYRATGLFARGTMVGNGCRAVFLFCYTAILIAGVPPLIYAAAYLATGIIGTLVIIWDTQRQIPTCRRISLSLAAAREGCVHLRGSLLFWLLALSNALNQQGVILVLAASGSAATVAAYATHRTVAGLVGYVGSLLQGPLWAELTFAYVQKNKDKMVRMSMLAIKTVLLLSGAVALGLWVLLPTIYPVWTGQHLKFQPTLLALFLGQAVLAAGWVTSAWSLLSTNQHRRMTYWSLANALLTLAFAIVLVPKFGVLGAACATLLGDVLCGAAVYPRLTSQLLGLSAVKTYQCILFPGMVLVVPGTLWLATASFMEGWQMLGSSVLCVMVLVYLTTYLAFSKQELDWFAGRFQILVRSRG